MNYTSYPQVIEFYTGIDRRRDNALNILINDIKEIRAIVDGKCGLPVDFNIYDLAQWKPSDNQIKMMHNEIFDGVKNSNLPDVVKDAYADKTYNNKRPLHQSISKILDEYSLLRLMNSISACSKALRNSDYSDPKIKHDLLNEILLGWEQLSKVLLVFSPILAEYGSVSVEGVSFILISNTKEEEKKNPLNLAQYFPSNVVSWYQEDIYSRKMSSLLINHFGNEKNNLIKHQMCLLLIRKRPDKWHSIINEYINQKDKNSFYLLDIYRNLRSEYKYGFLSHANLKSLEISIKKIVAKHELGIKNPGVKAINNVPNKALPRRETVD